ncbi:MAG: hypothetical protein H6Q00_284 [Holophagaceae bacterium]|nr:hypothetical protein [Holophagaceae bacterium]
MGLREINEKRTRELIERTARELFCVRGIGGTDLKEVAEAVGIPRTTLYSYYRDKHALAVAVYLRNLDSMLAHLDPKRLQRRLKVADGDLRVVISQTMDALVANAVKDPDAYIYDFAYNLHAAQGHEDPMNLEGYPTPLAPGLAEFGGIIQKAIDAGLLPRCSSVQAFLDLVPFPLVAYIVRLAVLERQKKKPDFAAVGRVAMSFKDFLMQGVFGL